LEEGINRLWVFPRRLRNLREEVVLAMDPTLVNLPLKGKVGIIKVNDIRPLTVYSDRFATRLMFSYALNRLRRFEWIVTLSDYTKTQLEAEGIDRDHIEVLPEPSRFYVEKNLRVERTWHPASGQDPFMVTYVATDRPYKNVDFFLQLAKKFGDEGAGIGFRLVSRLRPATFRKIESLGLRNFTVLESVDNIAGVYERTDLLVHPSLYEGFGLPLVEAMSFGIPVLANRRRPMSDVVGDAGILLEPNDLDGWADSIRALSAGIGYDELSRRAFERSDAFAPERIRLRVQDAFSKILA
jgi:glycosyltransferase involved in cell wall biosynthesis